MIINIPRYPHATYDSTIRQGYLVHYYPWDAVGDGILDKDQWRYESYSPEILNFKEGQENSIIFFVAPFLKLIQKILATVGDITSAHLIPVPSSIAKTDANFSTAPFQKGTGNRKNRDDRNTVFCNLIAAADTRIGVADILTRITSKPEKETWTEEKHVQSMALNASVLSNTKTTLILVDDVITQGGTMAGERRLVVDRFANTFVVSLAIGKSMDPNDFKPLSQNS